MSRARSAPAAKSRSARPAAGGARGVYVQSPKSDIFVALLGVSLGAMVVGCILLAWVLKGYDFSTKVSLKSAEQATIALATGTSEKIGTVRL